MDKKVSFPKEGISETIKADVNVKLIHDFDRFSNGHMLMTITEATVHDKDGKEVAKIRVDMGGSTVQAIIGGRSWTISIRELWPIFAEADKNYLEKEAK